MLLFDIAPLHNDALLVSFNELLHPFEKEAPRLLTKSRVHRLLDVNGSRWVRIVMQMYDRSGALLGVRGKYITGEIVISKEL
jgi:hypothetical protein